MTEMRLTNYGQSQGHYISSLSHLCRTVQKLGRIPYFHRDTIRVDELHIHLSLHSSLVEFHFCFCNVSSDVAKAAKTGSSSVSSLSAQ